MIYKLLYITSLLLIASLGFSQGKLILCGHVTDINGQELPGVFVDFENNKDVIVTNGEGLFYVPVKKPMRVQLSHPSLESTYRIISKSDMQSVVGDTLFMEFTLYPKMEELEGVEITRNRIERVYDKPQVRVVDYAFTENGFLLLILDNRQYQLKLVNHTDSVLYSRNVRRRPTGLEKDCMSNLHLKYSDSVYQLEITDSSIRFLNTIPLTDYNVFLRPCVGSTDSALFFYTRYANQAIQYYAINKISSQPKDLIKIEDQAYQRAVLEFEAENARIAALNSEKITRESIRALRDAQQNMLFAQQILMVPGYNPLIQDDSVIYVFDHVNDSLLHFDKSGNFTKQVPINHHLLKYWNERIFLDESSNRLFAKLEKKGITYLLQIHPENGHTSRLLKLERHAFPQKIKLKGGYAYYLHVDRSGAEIHNLYKQRID